MKIKAIWMVSAAALALTACGKKEDTTASNTTVASMDSSNDVAAMATESPTSGGQSFANAAAASDTFEIETSKAALTTSKSAPVKKFAQAMIDAHTESTIKLKAAAAAAAPAIMPDPALNAEQQAKLDALKAKTGADFDQAYVADQAAGHQQTLDALKAYSASGDVPSLKSFATELVPIVTGHLNMAKGLTP